MKKSGFAWFLILISILVLCFQSCDSADKAADAYLPGITDMPECFNNNEYIIYNNVFYNKDGDSMIGNANEKTGTFTKIHDSYSGRDRYYVWGYADKTRCCDWQWELEITDTTDLPPFGSIIRMSGTFEKSDKALDGYWYTSPQLSIIKSYTPHDADIDMTLMSSTLARVQFQNIIYKPDEYKGKILKIYCRILGTSALQHPYYDNSWSVPFRYDGNIPATGSPVIVTGTYSDSCLCVTSFR